MRVVHIIDSLAAHGAERSLLELAPFLLERGLQYEVAFLRDPDDLADELAGTGTRIHDLRGPDNRSEHTSRALTLFAALRPSLVHTTLYRSDVAGRSAANSLGIPSVTSWASTGPEHGNILDQVKRRRTTSLDRWTAQYASRFHAVSSAVADAVGPRLDVDPDMIDVIPRGRDPERLGERTAMRSRVCRDRLGLGPGPVVVALARHVPAKGIDTLIDAAAVLVSSLPELTVLIAGDTGSETEALTLRIEERRLERCVQLLGHRSDVGALLSAADVCAVPSRVEGFPGTVVEAMLVGTPVVATDLPSVRAALPDETFGWLVRPDDPLDLARSLELCLSHPTSGHDRALMARKHALRNFSMPAIADATIRFYERSLDSSRARIS